MDESEVSSSKLKPLLGTDEAVMDGKFRVLLSRKKRERLGDNFAMCLGENGCLHAYPLERWEQLVADIYRYEPTSQGRRNYTRLWMATADDELSCDEQGRVVIPKDLRKLAKLEKDVLVIGCGDRIEIWDKAEYAMFERFPEAYGAERRDRIEKAHREMKGETAAL